MKKIILECELVVFQTQLDEDLFFAWLKKIECISKIKGQGTTLYLEINPPSISDDSLRELFAVFSRYYIDLKQLLPFVTKSNKNWAMRWIEEGPNLEPPYLG